MLPLRKEKIKWSSELAYVVGLITTDGCPSNDGGHLDLTSKDIQLLKTFRKCLKLKSHLEIDNKETGRPSKLNERVLELVDSLD